MNGDNNDAQDLNNTDKDDGREPKNADNSDYEELKSADNSDGEVLLNAANDDGKDHLENADKNGGKDLNDGKAHIQNGDDSDGKDLQNTDENDDKDVSDGKDLQNTDENDDKDVSDGKDLQNTDENDDKDVSGGKDHLQNTNNNDGKDLQNADKSNDKGLNDGNDHLQNGDDNDGKDLQNADGIDNGDLNDGQNGDYSDDEDLHNGDHYPMFEQMYRCYPVSFIDKAHLENGDKVLMPPSALQQLAYSDIDFPILFEISNPSSGKVTHCGVLEFTANEGTIFLPAWMMEVMLIKEGDSALVKYTSLLKGTYVKLQPHTMDFLDISNPKAVLEKVLRSYSCLTTGGTIVLPYNNKKYYVDIVETKPSAAVCIIETDCEVDFAPPLDYKEPEKPPVEEEPATKKVKVGPFTGSGRRLDGKPSAQLIDTVSSPSLKQHQTNNSSGSIGSTSAKQQSGTLVFGSKANDSSKGNQKDSAQKEEDKKFKAFTGKKYSLKDNAS